MTDIDGVEEILKGVSRGPWVLKKADNPWGLVLYTATGGGYIIHPKLGVFNSNADAIFCALARDLIPEMVEEIKELRKKLEERQVDEDN